MKDTKELRGFLVEQMTKIADGTLEESRGKGVANLAQQVYNTLNIEMKMAGLKKKLGSDFEIKPVSFHG